MNSPRACEIKSRRDCSLAAPFITKTTRARVPRTRHLHVAPQLHFLSLSWRKPQSNTASPFHFSQAKPVSDCDWPRGPFSTRVPAVGHVLANARAALVCITSHLSMQAGGARTSHFPLRQNAQNHKIQSLIARLAEYQQPSFQKLPSNRQLGLGPNTITKPSFQIKERVARQKRPEKPNAMPRDYTSKPSIEEKDNQNDRCNVP